MIPSLKDFLDVLANYGFAIFAGVLCLTVAAWCFRACVNWALKHLARAGQWLASIVDKFVDTHLETQKVTARAVESLSGVSAETLSIAKEIRQAVTGKTGVNQSE
jgi:hypothetical protein